MPRGTNGTTLSLRDYIYIAGLLISIGIQVAQITSLRNDLATLQARYDREVVPRAEHIQMNAVLEQRLQSISERQVESQKQLNQVELKVDQVLIQQRTAHR